MKRVVRYFVSYAHADRKVPGKLLDLLAVHFGASAEYEFQRWRDTDILVGENWHDEIQNAIRTCDFGLLLVSPAFLGSQYIGNHELPHFVSGTNPCLPVALRRIDLENHDLKGLDATQLFRYQSEGAEEPRVFADYNAKLQADFAFELFGQVTERLKKLFGDDAGTRASTATLSSPLPNNLPRLQPFFGRDKELADIARALDPASRTWGTLIDGEGGKGKTALAVRAAYDCPPYSFDRIVFVSLKQQVQDDNRRRALEGFALSSWMQMLNEIARVLDLPEVGKAPESERARRLRDGLTGRRVLLVLDNLETLSETEQDQLFTFLEFLPSDCKALLTSRTFAGNKLLAIDLPELDQGSALQMLAEIAEHNPPFAKSSAAERICLYEQTRGNALLLRWVAGQVGCGHCTSIGDALEYLGTCPAGNDPLAFIFDDVIQSLGDQEVGLLATLTWPNQPIPVEAIAEIADVPFADARRWLKLLTNRSLVVPYKEEREYGLVPMVAEFLRKHRPEVVRETGDRLQNRAYALIVENGYEKHNCFPVLNAAWPSVAPALPLFLAGSNDQLQIVCDALWRFLDFTGRWDEWISLNQKAEAKAVAAGDHAKAVCRVRDAGWVHYLRKQVEAVFMCANRAAAHCEAGKVGARERAIAIRMSGIGHDLKSDYDKAITAYRECLDLHRSLSAESREVASVLNDIAEVEKGSGRFALAEQNYREALRIASALGAAEWVAIVTGNLAELALDRKGWLEAETLARESLPLSEDLGRQELIAEDCRRLAHALVRQSKAAEAMPHARRAVEIYTKLGLPDLAGAQVTLRECEGGGK